MVKVIEVLGSSEESFSEAVKATVNQRIASGENVSNFEVVEQRGTVRGGKFKDFQVKLRVAVELGTESRGSRKTEEHVCPTCLQPTGEAGHLCVPVNREDQRCEWCGALIADERHLCSGKIKDLSYICNSCCRTAVSPEYLCSPEKIE